MPRIRLVGFVRSHHREIIDTLTFLINHHLLLNSKPEVINRLISELDSAEDFLVWRGMSRNEIEKFRQKIHKAGDKFLNNRIRGLRKHPVWISKSGLTYHLTLSLVDAFPGLSQSKAVSIAAYLLVEFDIEPDKRVRPAKVLIPKKEPLIRRVEERFYRFKRKFGIPKSAYSELINHKSKKKPPTK